MFVNSSRLRATPSLVPVALLPIIAVVFIAFLVIGLALPVLPLHVNQDLSLGTFVVGLVAAARSSPRPCSHGSGRAITPTAGAANAHSSPVS